MQTNRPALVQRLRQAAAAAALCLGTTSLMAGELTIYSTTDGDNLKVIQQAFNKAHPAIKVNWIRD